MTLINKHLLIICSAKPTKQSSKQTGYKKETVSKTLVLKPKCCLQLTQAKWFKNGYHPPLNIVIKEREQFSFTAAALTRMDQEAESTRSCPSRSKEI